MSSTFAYLIKLISLYQLIIQLQFSQLIFFRYIVSQKAKPGNGRALYYSSSTMNLVRFEKIEVEFFCIHLLLRLLSFSWLQFSVEWFTTFLIIHQGVVCGLQMTLYRKKFVWKNIYFSICTSIIFWTMRAIRRLGYSHYNSILLQFKGLLISYSSELFYCKCHVVFSVTLCYENNFRRIV